MLSTNVLLLSLFLAVVVYVAEAEWQMKKIRSVQARVQGDEPLWDEKLQKYRSKYGNWLSLNTANTATVEGALMYVQAECVNYRDQSEKCHRKYDVKYVVMYDVEIVQPTPSVAFHADKVVANEYGTYIAMDGNRCTPVKGEILPDSCHQYYGSKPGQPALGPYVGGAAVKTDPRARYPDNYWFSYPNSCPLMHRNFKTKQCISEHPGGMCTGDEKLDGKQCTYAYKILGYIALDDLVGITSMKNNATGKNFTDLEEFCTAGKTEFYAEKDLSGFRSDLTFWNDPADEAANQQRSQKMIDFYHKVVESEQGKHMKKLPEIAQLRSENVPCYENVKICATHKFGCKRTLYAQICKKCSSDGEEGCVKAPADFKFPNLVIPTAVPTEAPTDDPTDGSGTDPIVNPTKGPTDPTNVPDGKKTVAPGSTTATPASASSFISPIGSVLALFISMIVLTL